jgi:hypothetical protein
MSRTDDVTVARAAADEWASARALPPSAGYSGSWYQNSYLGGWWPAGWLKWWADYNGDPDSLIGADVIAHQYSSTPIDQDAMLESEFINPDFPNVPPDPIPPDEPDPCADLIAQRDSLIVTIADISDRLGDLLLTEANTLKRPMRRWYVRGIVAQMAAERTAAIGARP